MEDLFEIRKLLKEVPDKKFTKGTSYDGLFRNEEDAKEFFDRFNKYYQELEDQGYAVLNAKSNSTKRKAKRWKIYWNTMKSIGKLARWLKKRRVNL